MKPTGNGGFFAQLGALSEYADSVFPLK